MEGSRHIDMAHSLKSNSTEQLAAEELRRRLRENNTANQFGFALIVAKRGRVVLKMRVNKSHLQVHGVVHGGVLAALADTAGGLATYMACPPGTRVATIEMKINYLEAVEEAASPPRRWWCGLDATWRWWIAMLPTTSGGW